MEDDRFKYFLTFVKVKYTFESSQKIVSFVTDTMWRVSKIQTHGIFCINYYFLGRRLIGF